MLCEKKPLSPDTLQKQWDTALAKSGIHAKTAISLSITNLDGDTNKIKATTKSSPVPSWRKIVLYIGSRCEIEIIGQWKIAWWSVVMYNWFPFCAIIIVAALLMLLLHIHKLRHLPPKIEVREVIKTVEVPQHTKADLYQLCPNVFLDTKKQLFIHNNKETRLSPQQYIILKEFADAPDYTLQDDDLLKQIWDNDKSAHISRFRVASQRLCNTLQKAGFHIEIKRIGIDKYRLFLPDIQ